MTTRHHIPEILAELHAKGRARLKHAWLIQGWKHTLVLEWDDGTQTRIVPQGECLEVLTERTPAPVDLEMGS